MTVTGLWRQFVPLAVSDVTMMASDPLVTTTLAHLPDARLNLAAVGVAKSLAVFFESPVIMLLHASNALAGSLASRRALMRFTLGLLAVLTALLVVFCVPAVFTVVGGRLLGIDASLADRVRAVLGMMVLWPAAIGWRRYFQGLLIHAGHPAAVARAGIARLAVVIVILGIGFAAGVPGAWLAALALIGGVLTEAVAVTALAAWHRVLAHPAPETAAGLPADLGGVASFYAPLAGSMLVVWGGRALLVAVVARSCDCALALAAWPAAWGLVMLVANATRMVQQVVIRNRMSVDAGTLWRFTGTVGGAFAAVLLALGSTSLGRCLVHCFVGADETLVSRVAPVLLACSLVPLLVAVQNAAQGFLIGMGQTGRVQLATWVGTAAMLAAAAAATWAGAPGALAAAGGMVTGLVLEVTWLLRGLVPDPAAAATAALGAASV